MTQEMTLRIRRTEDGDFAVFISTPHTSLDRVITRASLAAHTKRVGQPHLGPCVDLLFDQALKTGTITEKYMQETLMPLILGQIPISPEWQKLLDDAPDKEPGDA